MEERFPVKASSWEEAQQIVMDYVLTPRNLVILLATWILVYALERAIPKKYRRRYLDFTLLLSIAISSGLVWMEGLRSVDQVGWRIGLGIMLGFFSTGMTKLVYKLGGMLGLEFLQDPRKTK